MCFNSLLLITESITLTVSCLVVVQLFVFHFSFMCHLVSIDYWLTDCLTALLLELLPEVSLFTKQRFSGIRASARVHSLGVTSLTQLLTRKVWHLRVCEVCTLYCLRIENGDWQIGILTQSQRIWNIEKSIYIDNEQAVLIINIIDRHNV